MTKENRQDRANVLLIRYILLYNLLMVVIISAAGWYFYDLNIARSVLAGGIMASGSFFLLARDIGQMISRVSMAGDRYRAVKNTEKIRFLLKFYARLTVLGLLLFVLATKMHINMVALTVGLSTIILSVIIVFLSKGRKINSIQGKEGV
jgi:hypothetical protein